jgi:type VI secretion system protein ImpF
MAEVIARERLQPDLLMRLTDPERFVTVFVISTLQSELVRLRLRADELESILRGLGLRRATDDAVTVDGEAVRMELVARGQAVAPSLVKQLSITPPGAPGGITLQQFCTIESRTSVNTSLEGVDGQVVNARALREGVQRELSWLLNTMNLEVVQDLSRHPEVQRSVLNYGVSSFAGRAVHEADPMATAAQIRSAIEFFEPRLRNVQVVPDARTDGGDGSLLDFRIEAELWGNPVSQHVTMRTSIELDSGDVSVAWQAGS